MGASHVSLISTQLMKWPRCSLEPRRSLELEILIVHDLRHDDLMYKVIEMIVYTCKEDMR